MHSHTLHAVIMQPHTSYWTRISLWPCSVSKLRLGSLQDGTYTLILIIKITTGMKSGSYVNGGFSPSSTRTPKSPTSPACLRFLRFWIWSHFAYSLSVISWMPEECQKMIRITYNMFCIGSRTTNSFFFVLQFYQTN